MGVWPGWWDRWPMGHSACCQEHADQSFLPVARSRGREHDGTKGETAREMRHRIIGWRIRTATVRAVAHRDGLSPVVSTSDLVVPFAELAHNAGSIFLV